jgi:hypothetical protein
MPKQAALLPEDGAKFLGHVERVEDRTLQATCHAELHSGAVSHVEMPEHFVTDSCEKARAWINGMAAARGFRSWFDTSAVP